MMAYGEWLRSHAQKHGQIIAKLKAQGLEKDEIIAYFAFDNMVEKEPKFCKLYKIKEKCHEIEGLNCFLCACPYFRFSDDGIEEHEDEDGEEITLYSKCSINHKDGSLSQFASAQHQDCSHCIVPHTEKFIKKNYSEDLMEIMKECDLTD